MTWVSVAVVLAGELSAAYGVLRVLYDPKKRKRYQDRVLSRLMKLKIKLAKHDPKALDEAREARKA